METSIGDVLLVDTKDRRKRGVFVVHSKDSSTATLRRLCTTNNQQQFDEYVVNERFLRLRATKTAIISDYQMLRLDETAQKH